MKCRMKTYEYGWWIKNTEEWVSVLLSGKLCAILSLEFHRLYRRVLSWRQEYKDVFQSGLLDPSPIL